MVSQIDKFSFVKTFLSSTAKLTVVAISVRDYVTDVITVEGASMRPTLNPDQKSKDLVLVKKLGLLPTRYRRGDVVVLRSPSNPNEVLVKRLIGVQGDWLLVPGEGETRVIPQGHCWVEGDNPAWSEDSRSKYGPIAMALIEGRVTYRVWPLSRMGPVKSAEPKGRLLATYTVPGARYRSR